MKDFLDAQHHRSYTATEQVFRGLTVFFLIILAGILITGGGRAFHIDFRSLGAWVAPLLLTVSILYRSRVDPWPRTFHTFIHWVAKRPLTLVATLFTAIAVGNTVRFLTLNTDISDAGYVYQSLFQAFSTPLFKCDVCTLGSYLGEHQAWTLALLAPFVKLAGTPFAIPALACAIGFLIFFTVKKTFIEELGAPTLTFVFVALLSIRGFREAFFFDLREDLLGALFFTLALFFIHRGRPFIALIPVIFAGLSKESAVFLLPFVGLVAYFSEPRFSTRARARKIALILAYLGVFAVIFHFTFYVMLPQWEGAKTGTSNLAIRLAYLGSTPKEILNQIFTHPFSSGALIVKNLATAERFKYLLFTVGPFLYFMIRSWNVFYVPGLVLLLGNLMSVTPQQRMMQFHYELMVLPFFAFGLAVSLLELKNRGELTEKRFSTLLLTFFLVSGTWPISHLTKYAQDFSKTSDVLWARNEVAKLDPSSVILASDKTLPILTDHAHLRLIGGSYHPDRHSNKSPLTLGDSTHAVLEESKASVFLSEDWIKSSCGPKEVLCLYVKSK